MEAKKLCCGIDVSHTKLDVCYQNNLGELFHLQVGNNNAGYQKIIEHTGTNYHVRCRFLLYRIYHFDMQLIQSFVYL